MTPAFVTALFGTAAACVALAGWVLAGWREPFAAWLPGASAVYLVGEIGLTIAYHVPRNHALAKLEPTGADAPRHWARYPAECSGRNHVRAAAAAAAGFRQPVAGPAPPTARSMPKEVTDMSIRSDRVHSTTVHYRCKTRILRGVSRSRCQPTRWPPADPAA